MPRSQSKMISAKVSVPTAATTAPQPCASRRRSPPHAASRKIAAAVPASMRQSAVFAFMVTHAGWMRVRASMPNVQPAKPVSPIPMATRLSVRERRCQFMVRAGPDYGGAAANGNRPPGFSRM